MKKPWKVLKQENGSISIYGNNHVKEIEYEKPEWSEDEEPCFRYKGNVYFLSEFLLIQGSNPFKDFDGYFSDSSFSGILIKIVDSNEGTLKAYTYIS